MTRIAIILACLALPIAAAGQSQTLAATMEVYVFPTEGQDSTQQSKDEAECYEWAANSTGADPFALEKQEEANEQQAQAEQEAAEQAGQGAGARGAVRGAAAGAIIGEIADDDASQGAAYGAAAGAIRGRRMGRQAEAEAQQQAAAAAEEREEATEEQLTNFKNAFSVCLEAKDYMVKY